MALDERTCWFNVSITDGLGPVAAQRIANRIHERRQSATALIGVEATQLRDQFGLSDSVANALEQQLLAPVDLPTAIPGSELLVPGDEHFPNDRYLNANPPLPPLLWASGQRSLLAFHGATIGIAGSRDTSEEILELVCQFAESVSRQGWLVVSGLAQGVDSAAHHGAISGGTGTIGVLASGIANTSKSWSPDDPESICLVSQFSPTEPWSGPRAMQRNSTIAGLSDRVVVAVAGTSGGSWEMAQLCLKRKKPIFLLDLDPSIAEGNQKLIKAGATPLAPSNLEACLEPLDAPLKLFG